MIGVCFLFWSIRGWAFFLTFFALSTSLKGFLFLLFPDLAEQFYWVDKHDHGKKV
jgi:hypothetical protein